MEITQDTFKGDVEAEMLYIFKQYHIWLGQIRKEEKQIIGILERNTIKREERRQQEAEEYLDSIKTPAQRKKDKALLDLLKPKDKS